jgi:hypothetical protein
VIALRATHFSTRRRATELGFWRPVPSSCVKTASYALVPARSAEKIRGAKRRGGAGLAPVLERLPKSVTAARQGCHFVSSEAQSSRSPSASWRWRAHRHEATPDWKTQPAMAAGAASALMAEIASLAGREIAAESLGPAELPPSALRRRARIRFTRAGDAAPVLHVRLGVLRAGSGLAAQRADRGVVYWIEEARAAALPQSAEQFRASFAEHPAPAAAPAAKPAAGASSPKPK